MRPQLILEKFSEAHFEEYASWFDDVYVANALGYIDQEWLQYVLTSELGAECVGIVEGELVSEVGIVFPSSEHPFYVITNIAVNPKSYVQGWGRKTVERLLSIYGETDNGWKCYVSLSNKDAQVFFEKLGWKRMEVEDEMVEYLLIS